MEDDQTHTAAHGGGEACPWHRRTHSPWTGDEDAGTSWKSGTASPQKEKVPRLLGGRRAGTSWSLTAGPSQASEVSTAGWRGPRAGGSPSSSLSPRHRGAPKPWHRKLPGAACLCLPRGEAHWGTILPHFLRHKSYS